MTQIKVFTTINYALMVEVQETLTGYRLKLQYDSRALSNRQVDEIIGHFDAKFDGRGWDEDRASNRLAVHAERSMETIQLRYE